MSKTLNHADVKVVKTNFTTMGDIHNALAKTDAKPNEIKAISAVFSGVSIAKAGLEHGLFEDGEKSINNVNRLRARFATILLDMFRGIAAPVAEIVAAENEAESEIERQAELENKIAEWEKNGHRGRKPGEGNRPKSEIAIEKAHANARRQARENLGIPAQGRIVPEMQEKYVREFRDTYAKMLKEIGKKYADEVTLDADKIEKMVNKGIKDLRVSSAAQKAVKAKSNKAKKNKATETPAPDAEIPSTETADEPVNA